MARDYSFGIREAAEEAEYIKAMQTALHFGQCPHGHGPHRTTLELCPLKRFHDEEAPGMVNIFRSTYMNNRNRW